MKIIFSKRARLVRFIVLAHVVAALALLAAKPGWSGALTLLGVGSPPIAAPAGTGKVLLVDATSFLLQTDSASKVCLAGGC